MYNLLKLELVTLKSDLKEARENYLTINFVRYRHRRALVWFEVEFGSRYINNLLSFGPLNVYSFNRCHDQNTFFVCVCQQTLAYDETPDKNPDIFAN